MDGIYSTKSASGLLSEQVDVIHQKMGALHIYDKIDECVHKMAAAWHVGLPTSW